MLKTVTKWHSVLLIQFIFSDVYSLRFCFYLMNTSDLEPERQHVVHDPMQRYATYLKGVYDSALVSSDKFPNLTCNEFINLALVKSDPVSRSEAEEFTKATLHGHIDEILKKKEPIKLEEVLNPVEGQRKMKCVYIHGAPGVGKSTCVGELCRRWDEIDALKKYSLVILLRLREKRVQEAQNVEDLCYHDNKEVQKAVAAEIEACEGKDVLFILDGFDELPASLQKCSVFVKLITGTYLSHCTVLVTSRPSATADLLSVARPQIHKQVELIGFTEAHVEQYAKAFFASQPDVLADFLTYISTHPAIRSLMYIPLNSAITAETYSHNRTVNRPIPQTMTQLYIEMSLTLLQRNLGEDNPLAEQLPERLGDLPLQLHERFSSLAELAFEGLEKGEVIFHKLSNSFVHFGFMNSPTELYMGRKASISHSFLHLTLQEFLAAFHISQLLPSDQKSVFEKHCETAGWNVVWRFVAGLTGFHGIGWEVVQSRTRYMYGSAMPFLQSKLGDRVMPFLIRCLYEAQEKTDCDTVLGDSEVLFYGIDSLTAFDCYAVGYCVTNSKCMWKLDMDSNESLGGTLVEMLKHGLCSPSKSPPRKEYTNILSLNVQNCGLISTAFNQLADIIPLMINLKELNISFNPAVDGGLVKLLRALSLLKCLQTLGMSFTKIDCADIEALSCLISPSSILRKLTIGDLGMLSVATEVMLKTIFSPSSLEVVEFNGDIWTDQAVTLLEENNNLTTLAIWRLYSEVVCSVTTALCKNSHLKVLKIRFVSLNDEAVSSVAEILHTNQTLETLRLFNTLTQDQLLALNTALQFNHTLKTFQIHAPRSIVRNRKSLDQRITIYS